MSMSVGYCGHRLVWFPDEIEKVDGRKTCDRCKGEGHIIVSTHGCCGKALKSGECCGNAIEVPEIAACPDCGGEGVVRPMTPRLLPNNNI